MTFDDFFRRLKEKEKEIEKEREKFRDRGVKNFYSIGYEKICDRRFLRERATSRGIRGFQFYTICPIPCPSITDREEDERQCLAFIWNAHNLQGGATEWHFTRRYCALELYLSRVGNPRGDLIKLTKERRWPMEFIPTFEFQIGREKTFERICSSCLSPDICFTCVDPIRPRIKKRFVLSSR